MKITAKSSQRVLPPEGVHAARILKIIDLGTQTDEKYGKTQQKLRVSFELVDTGHVFKEELGEQPFLLDRTYTASLGDRASLKKDLESWRGKAFTDEEKAEFDLAEMLNSAGQIQVVYRENEGTTYANIGSLMALPKGMKVKKVANPLISFDLDEFEVETFEAFPEWLREVIALSPEYEAAVNGGVQEDEKDAIDELLD